MYYKLHYVCTTNLCSVHFLEQHRWAAEPWRIPLTLRCCPDPEHISPTKVEREEGSFRSKYLKQHFWLQTLSLNHFLLQAAEGKQFHWHCFPELNAKKYLCFCIQWKEVWANLMRLNPLTDSPGRGLSWVFAAASLASCSSLLRVWMAVSAESISMGPQASWAYRQRINHSSRFQ